MSTAIVRPANHNDLDQLEAMISRVDPGMLTMPSSREAMAARIERSLTAFARGSLPPENECYFLVMEEDGELLGTASIFTNLGVERPFYSYRISRDSKVSPEQGVKAELDLLFLVNDYHGDSELGTLFIERKARGGGRGRLLSFARLMLIAVDPIRFGPKAMAEIRGFTDGEGKSPFWDAVGAKFFHMDYRKADVLSARDHRFIADLMPRYPIYVALLPDAARNVISRPHPDAEPALAMLKSQGFRYNDVVDIFDAGPTVEAFIDHIDTVREAVRMSAAEFAAGYTRVPSGLIALADADRFVVTQFTAGDDASAVLTRIGAASSDEVLVYRLPGKRA
ncbi:MAG TPA: arginine N-succinyltransferase [Hyphomonadaceae bacterium]|nr:arginine N-succinyltransferase [Hyphomonadaceae bacterium]HPN07007.1 arginine N-succinyltransferase [Hyphomonadaceae bacterium]